MGLPPAYFDDLDAPSCSRYSPQSAAAEPHPHPREQTHGGSVAFILAAGHSTRMKLPYSKMLAPLAGRPMMAYAIETAFACVQDVYVIVSPALDAQWTHPGTHKVVQHHPRGTGDAFRIAFDAAQARDPGFLDKDILVLCADTPLLTPEDLAPLMALSPDQSWDLVLMGMHVDPRNRTYGRVICQDPILIARSGPPSFVPSARGTPHFQTTDKTALNFCHTPSEHELCAKESSCAMVSGLQRAMRIVETKDASRQHLDLSLCNTGVMRMRAHHAQGALAQLTPSATTGEFYLTDFVRDDASCWVIPVNTPPSAQADCTQNPTRPERDQSEDRLAGFPQKNTNMGSTTHAHGPAPTFGRPTVNTQTPLWGNGEQDRCWHFRGVNTLQERQDAETLLQGRLRRQAQDKGVLFIGPDQTFLSWDTVLAPGVIVHPFVTFGPGVIVDEGAVVHSFSVLSGCHIRAHAQVGPFAHVRSGTVLDPHSVIGNFVEIKNTHMGSASQAKHLSYLGDASIGAGVNIGAGVITCNYDGHAKHPTHIQDRAFIGSQTTLIAPVTIGENATIGAGSVITAAVPPATLALSRVPQRVVTLPADSKHLRRKDKTPPGQNA